MGVSARQPQQSSYTYSYSHPHDSSKTPVTAYSNLVLKYVVYIGLHRRHLLITVCGHVVEAI